MHETTRGGSGRRRRRRRLQKRPARTAKVTVTMWRWATPLVALWAAAAMAAPDRENAIALGARAGSKSKACGLPGARPCRSSEEDSIEFDEGGSPGAYENYPDNYGTYDDGFGDMDDNASRVDGNIPVLEAFPLLEPKPYQHAQMMLQEAPPFTWLVQSDTPPRSGKIDSDSSSGSLLGSMSGGKRPGGRGKGRESSRESSRERSVVHRTFHI